MKNENKCSSKGHHDAVIFCQDCHKYMCSICEEYHKGLFNDDHEVSKLEQNGKIIFNLFCKEAKHKGELKYFCKTHNILCCIQCISKIRDENNGQHNSCDICPIKEIEEEKKNKLKKNIETLDILSENIEDLIEKLKENTQEINNRKEMFKKYIKEIFSLITKILKERENKLLLELEDIFNIPFFNEDSVQKGEILPNRIKQSLENGKKAYDEINNYNLEMIINSCLDIENCIKEINIIKENVENYNINDYELKFIPKEEEIKSFIAKLDSFGKIDYNFENDKREYSYEIIAKNLKYDKIIYEGTHEEQIEICLNNNGKYKWPKNNTKLVFDEDSKIIGNEVVLGPQKPGESKYYLVNIKNISQLPVGVHSALLIFLVNEKPFGEKIKLKIVIKPKKESKNKFEQYKIAIENFRNKYNLSKNDYSDEKLLEVLLENKLNEELAFSELFS